MSVEKRSCLKSHRPQNELERRVYVVLSRAYFGIHHVQWWERRRLEGSHTVSVTVPAGLDTYDGSTLTRLVIAAHDECVRVEVHPAGPHGLRLFFTMRRRRGYGLELWTPDSHPTIETAIQQNRNYRWIVDVPTEGE
jgi:hypothetical protein